MTVENLINELSKLKPYDEVCIHESYNNGYKEITHSMLKRIEKKNGFWGYLIDETRQTWDGEVEL